MCELYNKELLLKSLKGILTVLAQQTTFGDEIKK
jgi:hypothetical protein